MLFNKGLALCGAMVLAVMPGVATAQSIAEMFDDGSRDQELMERGRSSAIVRLPVVSTPAIPAVVASTPAANVISVPAVIAAPVVSQPVVSAPAPAPVVSAPAAVQTPPPAAPAPAAPVPAPAPAATANAAPAPVVVAAPAPAPAAAPAPAPAASSAASSAVAFNASTFLSGEWFSGFDWAYLRDLLASFLPIVSNQPAVVGEARPDPVVEVPAEPVLPPSGGESEGAGGDDSSIIDTIVDVVKDVIDTVVDTVVDTVGSIVDAVTGGSKPADGVEVDEQPPVAPREDVVAAPPPVIEQPAPVLVAGQLPKVQKTFEVHNRTELWAALVESLNLEGAVIRLHPGDYGSLLWKSRNHAKGRVFLVAATTQKPVFTKLDFVGSQNIAVSGVTVAGAESILVNLSSTRNIILTDSLITSENNDRDPWNNGNSAMHIRNAHDVTVSDVTIEDLRLGIYVQRSSNVIIRNNTLQWLREGMNVTATDRILLQRNYFTEFHPNYAKSEHPDSIQFWNRNEVVGVSNAKLIENVMIHGGCRPVQGLFLGAEQAANRHSNFEIRGNIYYGSSPHGITVSRTDGVKMTGNVVVTSPNGDRNSTQHSNEGRCGGGFSPRMRTNESTNVVAFGNVGMTTPLLQSDGVKYDNINLNDNASLGTPWHDVFAKGRMTSDQPSLSEFVTKSPSLARSQNAGLLAVFAHGNRKLGPVAAVTDALAAHQKGA